MITHFFRLPALAGSLALFLALLFTGSLGAQTSTVCRSVDCITERLRTASPGDEIIVASGTYNLSRKVPTTFSFAFLFSDRNGTSSRPITFRGENPSNPPNIVGLANNNGYLLSIEGDYWVIRDLKFRRGAKGIMLDNANHCRLINLTVSDVGEEGIHLRDASSNNLVRGCTVFDTGRNKPGFGEGLYVGSDRKQHFERRDEVSDPSKARYRRACDNNTIENCTIGPNVTAEGVDIKEGTRRTIIRNNNFIARGVTGENSGDACVDAKGADVFIYDNTFDARGEPNLQAGVDFQDRGTNFNTGTRIAITNNRFLKDGQSGTVNVARRKGGNPTQVHVWDNIGIPAADLIPGDGSINYITQSCPTASWNNVISCSGTPPPPPPPSDPCAGSGTSINGRIQAESYCAMNGLRTQATSDAGGGLNVGWIDVGDYADYRINVPAAGTYTLSYRIASLYSSGEVQFRSGSRVLATTTIPNTGAWQNWRTITTTVELSRGNQTLRLFASGARWNINWFTLEEAGTPPPPPPPGGGGGSDATCSFGAPASSALPTLDRLTFGNVHVLGSGGPALANFRQFSINYRAGRAAPFSFAINTSDGNPGYYVDLLPNATTRFNRAQPDVTLSNTGLAGLDGNYWIVKTGDNIALVEKNDGYTVYFSNSGTPPNCSSGLLADDPGRFDAARYFTDGSEAPVLYPNPASSRLQVSQLAYEPGTYRIIDMRGAVLRQAAFSATEKLTVSLQDLPTGSYLIRVEQAAGQWNLRFVRTAGR